MPSKIQEMLRLQRQNAETARAGLAWDADEENRLTSQVLNGVALSEIARVLQRTEGSIRTRLLTIVCNKIDNSEETSSSAFEKYGVSAEELDEFRDKKKKRDERQLQRQQNRIQKKPNGKQANLNHTTYTLNDVVKHLVEITNDLNRIKFHLKIH